VWDSDRGLLMEYESIHHDVRRWVNLSAWSKTELASNLPTRIKVDESLSCEAMSIQLREVQSRFNFPIPRLTAGERLRQIHASLESCGRHVL